MKQVQTAGDGSVNIQGTTVVVNTGLTVSDVRQIALDTVRGEIASYSAKAQVIAQGRAEVFSTRLVERVIQGGEALTQSFEAPDVQVALRDAGVGYVRSGDADLGRLLIDLVVARLKRQDRDLISIVLGEAIAAAPKLLASQIDALTLIFGVKSVRLRNPSLDAVFQFLREACLPVARTASRSESSFAHLAYCGCVTSGLIGGSLAKVLQQNYPGLFTEGFTREEGIGRISADVLDRISVPLERREDRWRFRFASQHDLAEGLKELALTSEQEKAVSAFFQEMAKRGQGHALGALSERSGGNAALAVAFELMPDLPELSAYYDDTPARIHVLTSVGVALAHARFSDGQATPPPLSIWIADGS